MARCRVTVGVPAASVFSSYVSGPVVQAKCAHCHVPGGVSGHTRLVLHPAADEGHEALNLAVFENFLASVEGAADLILNKIQGVAHGGGVQVQAGSADFANMEKFLRLLGGATTSPGATPNTLFDGVTMASPAKTLRRAALLFAGRLPTQAETSAVSDGRTSSLRRTIRGLMSGPGFHQFLIRSANDRLLTDRRLGGAREVINEADDNFPAVTNKNWELKEAALANGIDRVHKYPAWAWWIWRLNYGAGRAPLELIARVAENDLPYTEVLTADYIMANPVTAQGYGASTKFDDPGNPFEFKPSRIVSYYRDDDSKIIEDRINFATRVINPGNLITEYPHAGILNTTVFLRRYPTTATNRNRARARWTNYHFLGLDIEKSASRTTDPVALADRDNPTMKNPSCTVCHRVMDPVAGTFQNYGEEGGYRDNWGGLDSLAGLYKNPEDGSASLYQPGDTWYRDMREPGFDGALAPNADSSLQWLAQRIVADTRFAEAAVKFWWAPIMGSEVSAPPEDERDSDFAGMLLASNSQAAEVEWLANVFRTSIGGRGPFNLKDLLTEIALSPWFRADTVADIDPVRAVALRNAGMERMLTPEELARKTESITGYGWGRRFRWQRGVVGRLDYNDWGSYNLLYGGIDSDGITTRSRAVTPLMAAVAQSHAIEVSCPVVQREFFLSPDSERRLFGGIDKFDTPHSEAAAEFAVVSESTEAWQTSSLEVSLAAGPKTVRLSFINDYFGGQGDDRNMNLDRLVVRDRRGTSISEVEMKSFAEQDCGAPSADWYLMWSNCSLAIPVQIAADGNYLFEVTAMQEKAGDESARMAVSVESNEGSSRGERAIRGKLVDLHQKLLGVTVTDDSPEVESSYQFFLEVWNRKRSTQGVDFRDSPTECDIDDHFYFDGIADKVLRYDEWGDSHLNWDRAGEVRRNFDFADPSYTARSWVVVLAGLLTDYRYLYF